MISILEEVKIDFEQFKNDYDSYKDKVNNLSDLFKLKNKAKLRSDFLPTYFVGNYLDKNYKYVLFGINPGFSEKQNHIEEAWKSESWMKYNEFILNFFNFFKKNNMKSPYYKKLSQLFAGLDNLNLEDYSDVYDYFQNHILNLELIPYHSTSFGISNKLSDVQKTYFENRFRQNLDFLKNQNVKLMVFNGKPFYLLLIKNNLIKFDNRYVINKYISMFTFRINGIPCVLFDKFLTQAGFGLSYDNLKVDIKKLIVDEFGNL
jgi:hypothetical protein